MEKRPTLDDIVIDRLPAYNPQSYYGGNYSGKSNTVNTSETWNKSLDRSFHDYRGKAKLMEISIVDGNSNLITIVDYVPNIQYGHMFWHGDRREVIEVAEDEKRMQITLKKQWKMLRDER